MYRRTVKAARVYIRHTLIYRRALLLSFKDRDAQGMLGENSLRILRRIDPRRDRSRVDRDGESSDHNLIAASRLHVAIGRLSRGSFISRYILENATHRRCSVYYENGSFIQRLGFPSADLSARAR